MKSIIIVGAGALGSHLVLLLRNLSARITVIDFDRVERKNVQSQFHSKTHVGKLKVQALQQTMKFLFDADVHAASAKLTRDNVDQLLSGSDLIVDCVDNAEARKLIQDYARATSTACLHGGLAANGEYGIAIWDEHFNVSTSDGAAGGATCEDGEHLPFIAGVSAQLANAVKHFITDGKKYGYHVSPGHMART